VTVHSTRQHFTVPPRELGRLRPIFAWARTPQFQKNSDFLKSAIDFPPARHYVPVLFHPQRGVSRSSRNAGRNAMDATASGARSVAGRESLEWVLREQRLRADDTALTASSHGLDGERTPAVENPAKTCADGQVVWSWRPKLASSPWRRLIPTGMRAPQIHAATGAMELVSPRRARSKS
jgi:hypothetical protein